MIAILIPLAVGGVGAFFTMKGLPFYMTQKKPWFAPPELLFPIVWSILYILMGVGSALVCLSQSPKKAPALRLYGTQLAVNLLWSVIFFALHWYLLAFFWLLLLIALILNMIQAFREVNKTAANLQIPYLLWCLFAAILNFSVYFLNR